MKTVIDADQIPYAAGASCKDEPLAHALQMAKKMIQKIIKDTECGDDYEIYISGEGNYRDEIALTKPYKGHRPEEKNPHYEDIREYLQSNWGATKVDGMEVDDRVSILLWEDFLKADTKKEHAYVVLSSPDKDLNNTPGWHYNPRTRETYWVTQRQADRHFYWQMLMGDPVDNIPGLPHGDAKVQKEFDLSFHIKTSCGKKTATEIMKRSTSANEAEENMYFCYVRWAIDCGLSYEDLVEYIIEQGQLLWMLREENEYGPVHWEPDMSLLHFEWVEETKGGI